jgi:acetyltransferase-like isoleucine patch superfamily enzyme
MKQNFENVKFKGSDIYLGEDVFLDEGTWIHNKVRIEDGVRIGRNVRIYENVHIGKGTVIEDGTIVGYRNLTKVWKEDDDIDKTYIGEGVLIRPNCVIYTGCTLGNNVKISHSVILRELTKIGNNTSLGCLIKGEGYCTIGSNCSIHTLSVIASFMTVEDYVFMGPRLATLNDYRIDYKRDFTYEAKGPTIKFGARIAASATIMPAVVIGREALIGAGAVVTKDVPDYKVAYGVPARIVGNVKEEERLKIRS